MERIFKVCQLLAIVYFMISDTTCQPPENVSDLNEIIASIFDIPMNVSDLPSIEPTGSGYPPPQLPPDYTETPLPPLPSSSPQPQQQAQYPSEPQQPQQLPQQSPPPPPQQYPVTQSPKPAYQPSSEQTPFITPNSGVIEPNPCKVGECVPYYLCANGTIITSGENILDVRFGEEDNPDPVFHPCKGLFQTCCSLKRVEPDIPIIVKKDGCGFRNDDGVGFRITGQTDNEAQYGEFPWMVAIIKEEPSLQDVLNVYQCGGSLIHPSVVLTAAHCVHGKQLGTLKIRAGEWDTQTRDELFPHQDRLVSDIIIHENYYKGGLFNDVALLILQEPVELSEIVNTACLPPQDYNFDGSRCFASGWGKDVWGKEGKYQVILKKVDLPIIPREPCVKRLRTTRLGQHFNLHSSFICAGGEPGKDTCKGDGGSPLVCPIPGEHERYFQTGIVSWGIGCAGHNPGVYASVAQFRTWIDQQFQYKLLDTSYYSK